MADEIDLANDLIDNEVSRALSKIRQHAALDTKGSEFCMECGDAMPVARQNLGFKFCVPCAEESERRRALFADNLY
jgi:RNA polymerase-binding transcription factor DksA